MSAGWLLVLGVLLLGQADLGLAAGTTRGPVLVFTISRHGARNVLPKAANLSETDNNGGPTLLPQGQRQQYNAGEATVCTSDQNRYTSQ